MFSAKQTAKAALFAALLGTAASGAASGAAKAADTGTGYITTAFPNEIVVKSNGSDYTEAELFGMTNLGGTLQYDTGTAGRIHSWKAWAKIFNGYGIAAEVPNTKSYATQKSYPFGSRPKSINQNIVISVPASLVGPNAVGMCNFMASGLRNQGKSDQEIFGQDREVHFEVYMGYEIDASGAGSGNPIFEASSPHNWKVRCAKWNKPVAPAGVSDLKQPLEVIKATMQLQEITALNGTCKVATTTAIRANEANATIEYRFLHAKGYKSQVFSTKTAGNGIAVVKHDWDIPHEEGQEQGWFQIEGVSPNFESNKAGYIMDCKVQSAGGFQQKPQGPQPAIDLKAQPAQPGPKPITDLKAQPVDPDPAPATRRLNTQ